MADLMTQPNRFLLFGGDIYYAQGGWEDFHSSHPLQSEAEVAGRLHFADEWQWWHVVDVNTYSIVVLMRKKHGSSKQEIRFEGGIDG